jgi:hypothetical protein
MIKSPFFDSDPRYQIIDMVASGTSYSGTSFDIIYSQGGAISFS